MLRGLSKLVIEIIKNKVKILISKCQIAFSEMRLE